jgi:hypothetical protein
VLLGDQLVPCAGCRHRQCPLPGQPCLADVTPTEIVAAVELLAGAEVQRARAGTVAS